MNPVANSLRASEHPQGPKFFSFLSHSSTRLYFISSVRDVVTLRQSAPSPKYFLIRLFADGLLSVPPSKPCRCCGGSDYSLLAVQGRQEGLEPASGRTRAVAVKENTVKHLPKYGFSAERREEPAGTKLGARLAWAHLGDLPWHPQLMSRAL